MKRFWYLPIAAVAGATSLTIWGQANAGPPPEDSPGVVVTADVTSGRDAKPEDSASRLPTPTPTASITAIPDHSAPETLMYSPLPTDSPTQDQFDDKGGLREDGVSDDGPTHDLNDDKGGLREDGDDKSGDR